MELRESLSGAIRRPHPNPNPPLYLNGVDVAVVYAYILWSFFVFFVWMIYVSLYKSVYCIPDLDYIINRYKDL
jgi:hypothetical protein